MNLFKLGISVWIVLLNIILISILYYKISFTSFDSFVNYPELMNPLASPKSGHGGSTANNDYASLLMYIQSNPSDSVKFIEDIKSKFFENNCKIKNDIDFSNIAQMPSGLPFGN